VIDERGYYYQFTGLLNYEDTGIYPNIIWAKEGKRLSRLGNQAIIERSIGFRAWFAGPQIHVCDMYALIDPLMARLPCETRMGWRIGHFMRTAPEGYEETLAIGYNSIANDSLRVFLDRLWVVVRGPIFSFQRFVEMFRFNLGFNQHLVNAYTDVPMIEKTYEQISTPVERGTPVRDSRVTRISRAGLRVELGRVRQSSRLELGIDDRDNYFLQFRRDAELVGSTLILLQRIPGGGIRVDTVAVPDSVIAAGYNQIDIAGVYGDDRYYVGFLRLLE
jgi:arabinofuranosyltransferase